MEPLTEDVVYRELQQLLTAEPSPNFVARVRTTIANQPAHSVVPGMSLLVALGVAAMTLLIAASVYFTSTRLDDTLASAPQSRGVADIKLTPDTPSASLAGAKPPMRGLRASGTRPQRRPPEPWLQVMVSADDVQAFERLVRSTREETFVLSFEERNHELALTELTIAPITTEPLAISEQQGVIQ